MQATQSGIASGMKLDARDGSGMGPSGGVGAAEDAAELPQEAWAEPMPPLTLLVVDDDGTVRAACRDAAVRMGFVVSVAEDVAAARIVLQRQPVDLALLDLKMPGGGGLALFEVMKREHPETGVVVMTAFATVASAVEAMRLGAVDYLTKPFLLEELTAVLERARQLRQVDVRSRRLRERLRHGAWHGRDGWAVGGDGEAVPLSVEGGVFDASSADSRRERDGQGAGGAVDPFERTERGTAVSAGGLRVADADADRERAVLACEGRVYRGGPREGGSAGGGGDGGRSFWTRSVSCRWICRPSCCGRCRRKKFGRWGRRRRCR